MNTAFRRPTPCLLNRIHAWCHAERVDSAGARYPRLVTNRQKLYHGRGDVEGSYTYAVVDVADFGRIMALGDDLNVVAAKLGLVPRGLS